MSRIMEALFELGPEQTDEDQNTYVACVEVSNDTLWALRIPVDKNGAAAAVDTIEFSDLPNVIKKQFLKMFVAAGFAEPYLKRLEQKKDNA